MPVRPRLELSVQRAQTDSAIAYSRRLRQVEARHTVPRGFGELSHVQSAQHDYTTATSSSASLSSLAQIGQVALQRGTPQRAALSPHNACQIITTLELRRRLHYGVLQFLRECNVKTNGYATMWTDSITGKAMVSGLGVSRATKHTQLRLLYIQGLVSAGYVGLRKVAAKDKLAGLSTKSLPAKDYDI